EAADQPHAVELAGAFLEAADEEHLPVKLEHLVSVVSGALGLRLGGLSHRTFSQYASIRRGAALARAFRNWESGTGGMRPLNADHVIARVRKAQNHMGALLQEVARQMVVAQQLDPGLQLVVLKLEPLQLGRFLGERRLARALAEQPAVAGQRLP